METTQYILYGDRCSGAAAIELALAELGVSYEFRTVALESDEQRSEAFAAINPQRKLPAVVTAGGETLTESAAILLTLAERHAGAGLMPPPGTRERAQAVRWLVYVAAELYPIVEIIDYPERFAGAPESAPAVRERARAIWRDRLLVLEAAIAGDPWLLASGFCAVDLYLAVVTRWGQQSEWRPANVPRIEAIAAAVAERPVAGPVWRRHWP